MKTKTMLLVIVLILIAGAIYYFESSKAKSIKIQNKEENPIKEERQPSYKDRLYEIAPELRDIAGYINADENIKISNLRGKVVLIDFWTYSCINCIRTLPYLTEWDRKYRDKGLIIIGVHTPEFEFEKDYNNVKSAVEKYNIKYSVVQDNNKATWKAYNNRFWPRKYLIDPDGYIRYDHIGEGAYEETELKIQELLSEIGVNTKDTETVKEKSLEKREITPELYAGFDYALPRGQNVGNPGGLQTGKTVDYALPEEIKEDIVYLNGKWQSNSDDLIFISSEKEGKIILKYKAQSLNIVASSPTRQIIEVFIDGNYIVKEKAGFDVEFLGDKAIIRVDSPRLYNLVDGDYGDHQLLLKVKDGFSFNSFTFG